MLRGRLNLRSYLRSLSGPLQFALVAADDPLPGLMDLPIFAFKHIYNAYLGLRKSAAATRRVPAKS
jgi:predicted ATP-grasp superfamily ATP-dependent carboligase